MKGLETSAEKWRLAALFLLMALIICLIGHFSSITVDWNKTKDAADAIKNFGEVVAIVGGATWAFFKFRKGRTYQETLGLKVSGKFISFSGVSYLSIVAEVRNVGLSNVQITEKGTGIALWRYKYLDHPSGVLTVTKESLAGFSLVEDESNLGQAVTEDKELFFLEPNESITFERLVGIPPPLGLAVRIELQVASASKYAWTAATIIREAASQGES